MTQPAEAFSTGRSYPPAPMTARPAATESPPGWRRSFEDLPREHGFEPMRVVGALPADLEGTLFRNGPGLLTAFGQPYDHWFDGDGAVSAVRMLGGRAAGAVRVVRTPGLAAERRSGKRLYSGFATRSPRPIREHLFGQRKNPANVNVIAWHGRVFALGASGRPIEISAEDLSTLGEMDPDDVGLRSSSAHPHEIPGRSALVSFGVSMGRTTSIDVVRTPRGDAPEHLASFRIAGASLIHDFAATSRHLVFIIPPLRLRLEPMRLVFGGGSLAERVAWKPGEGTEIVVVPIDDPTNIVRFVVDPFFPLHTCNAFERGGELVVDVTRSPALETSNRWFQSLPSGAVQGELDSTFWRMTFDLRTRTMTAEERLPRACELPRIAPSACGEAYRHAYLVAHSSRDAARSSLPDRLLKLDVTRGRVLEVSLGPEQYPSEPVFVPARGAVEEDDGYVLTQVYDGRTHETHLAVLDAQAFDAGPLARVHFGHHIPYSFHGTWVPGR